MKPLPLFRTSLNIFLLSTVLSTPFALAEGQRHDRRQNQQRARIHQGVESGALTPGETRALNRQQKRIQRMENKAQADGIVTPAEKARLEKSQNRANRKIRRLKHNSQSNAAPSSSGAESQTQ